MERIILTVLLLCFHGGLAQNEDTVVEITTNSNQGVLHLEEGAEDVTLTCRINKDLMFMVRNEVTWKRQLVWDGVTTDTLLSASAVLKNADPNLYNIDFTIVDDHVDLVLTIYKVRREDDGLYICNVTVGSPLVPIHKTDTLEVVVYKPIERHNLKFGQFRAIEESPSSDEPVEVDAGQTYQFVCNAEGSNPGVETNDLQIILDDKELTDNVTKHGPMEMPVTYRAYQTHVNGEIEILVDHDSKVFECRVKGPQDKTQTIKFQFKVRTVDPVISCQNSEGYTGKMYVAVTCSVNTTGVDKVNTFFRMADKGRNLYEGTNEYNGDNFNVVKKVVNDDLFNITMTIHKARSWHFDERLLVVVESAGNHVTEERVRINRIQGPNKPKPGPNNGSANQSASLATLLCCVLAGLYARLL